MPAWDLAFDGAPHVGGIAIGFDPTGNDGYVVLLGDVSGVPAFTLMPVIYRTRDGGASWDLGRR